MGCLSISPRFRQGHRWEEVGASGDAWNWDKSHETHVFCPQPAQRLNSGEATKEVMLPFPFQWRRVSISLDLSLKFRSSDTDSLTFRFHFWGVVFLLFFFLTVYLLGKFSVSLSSLPSNLVRTCPWKTRMLENNSCFYLHDEHTHCFRYLPHPPSTLPTLCSAPRRPCALLCFGQFWRKYTEPCWVEGWECHFYSLYFFNS